MMTDVNDNEIKIETKPTIGERLRLAREAKNLTINDIATELCLTKHTIEYIENEQWAELHGRAYARGYFSNYIKFLGLPEDELLAAFNSEYTIAEPTLLVTKDRDVFSNKKSVWFPFLLILIVSVLSWFAYQQWQKIQNTTDSVGDKHSSLFSETTNKQAILSEEANTQHEPVVTAPLQQEISEPEQYVELQHSNDLDADLGVEQEQEQEQEANDADEQVSLNNNEVVTSDGILDLHFTDDCWVEVKDANTRVLLNKIMKKGESISLNGPAPLLIMLGRASAVNVKFNNQEFDTLPYTQRDVARFTLGEAS